MVGVLMAVELAKVWQARGDVYVVRAGHVIVAKKGTALKVGDVVRVGDRSFAKLKYYDGSYVRVAPGSVLKIKDEKGIYLSRGRVLSKIRKVLGKKGFYVSTQTAVAGVRGTEFEVNVKSDSEVEVVVYEGKVEVVDLRTMKKALVEKGKALKLSIKEAAKELEEIDVGEIKDDWKEIEKEAKKYEDEMGKIKKSLRDSAIDEEELKDRMEELKEAGKEIKEAGKNIEEIKEELAEVKKEAKELEEELSEYRDAIEDAMEEMTLEEQEEWEQQYEPGELPGGGSGGNDGGNGGSQNPDWHIPGQ